MDIGRTPVTERCRCFFYSYIPFSLWRFTNGGLFGYDTGFSTSFTRISFALAYFGGSRYTVPGVRPSELVFIHSILIFANRHEVYWNIRTSYSGTLSGRLRLLLALACSTDLPVCRFIRYP